MIRSSETSSQHGEMQAERGSLLQLQDGGGVTKSSSTHGRWTAGVMAPAEGHNIQRSRKIRLSVTHSRSGGRPAGACRSGAIL